MLKRHPNSAFQVVAPSSPGMKVEDTSLVAAINQRCLAVEKGIRQLKKDHQHLLDQIKKSPYQEGLIDDHLDDIKSKLETTLQAIRTMAEQDSGEIWNTLERDMARTVDKYIVHLRDCKGRQEVMEWEQGLSRLEKLLDQVAASSSSEKERLTCCVCMENQVDVSIKCGHLLCSVCAQSVDKCPVCRKPIQAEHLRSIYFT